MCLGKFHALLNDTVSTGDVKNKKLPTDGQVLI